MFDDLSVRVTADTDSFERGIDSAEQSLSGFNPDILETSAALQVLQGRADEAGDELFDIAPRAATASAGLEGVSLSATGASTSFGILATTTVVSLVPALVTLSSVLAPIVGALGGFVAIAASIGGIGLAGLLGAIAVNGERLKTEFQDLIETAIDVFAPAIQTATAVLEIWMDELEAILPALAPTTSELEHLGGIFANLGSALIDLLPSMVQLGITLTRDFLPGFIDFVNQVGPQLPGIIQSLVGLFERLLPTVLDLGRWLRGFLPEFTEFGFLTLSVITPALTAFGNVVMDAITAVNNLDDRISGLIAVGSLLAPVLLGIATLLTGPIAAAIGIAIGAVITLNKVWSNNIGGIQQRVQEIRKEIVEWVNVVVTEFQKGLQPVLSDLQQLIQDNQEEFSIIADGIQAVVVGFINLATTAARIVGPALRVVLIPLFRGVIDVLDFAITKLAQFIELAGAVQSGDISEIVDAGSELVLGAESPELAIQTPDPQQTDQISNRIELVIEENTDLTEARIQNSAETVVRRQERQTRRNSGRNATPR